MATLQVAVLKRAQMILWRLAVVAALESGSPVPPPPNILVNRREAVLHAIYVEQRRLLYGSLTWAPEGFLSDRQSIGHNAAVAYAELEHWKLGCEALSSEMRHEIPIDIDEEMSRLSALAGFAPLPTLESDAALRLATEADVNSTLPFDFTRPALDLKRRHTNRQMIRASADP